jgi:hypothetical protein
VGVFSLEIYGTAVDGRMLLAGAPTPAKTIKFLFGMPPSNDCLTQMVRALLCNAQKFLLQVLVVSKFPLAVLLAFGEGPAVGSKRRGHLTVVTNISRDQKISFDRVVSMTTPPVPDV